MDLERQCRELFEAHRQSAFDGTFHVPSLGRYPGLFAWDSGYHALALRHLDPELAMGELRALYAANRMENGLLAHERPLPEAGQRTSQVVERLGPIYREDGRSWLIDPPVAAYAAARLALQVGDQARDLLELATAHLDAIWSERLPPDTGLPVILHPLESGTDASPLFESVVESTDRDEWCEEIANLTRSAVACGFDPERALRAGHPFVVEDPVFCGWLLLALEEVWRAWERYDERQTIQKLRIRTEMIAEALRERLWWEDQEIYAGYDRRRGQPMAVVTAGGLIPAATHSLLEEGSAKRAVERHLRSGGAPLWGPSGVSFNPVLPDRPVSDDGLLWRGNVVWAVTQYWAHLCLVGVQRTADARLVREQLERLIAEHGFREYYDAVSGEGHGAGAERGFTWPALVLEMAANEVG